MIVLPEYLGTLPQQISALGIVAVLGTLLRFRLGWRKLGNVSEADIRDHYAQEVAALREHQFKLEKHWREMLSASDKRHEECEQARQVLRKELSDMHEELRGVKDKLRDYSTDKVLMMENGPRPSEVAPHSLAAAKRLKEGGEDK